MSINTSPNTDYAMMQFEVKKVRDAIRGSFFVKREPRYLPHPSQVDTKSNEAKARYAQYTWSAEFPEFTKSTLVSMLDKMKIADTTIDIDSRLEYLKENSDGDGLSLKGLIESCASNILPVGYHVLIADKEGISDINTDNLSISEFAKINSKNKATISQYSRENVIDWAFDRINGRVQLSYLLLRETGETVDLASGERFDYETYLKLTLTEEGYFQQKITDSTLSDYSESAVYPIIVNGKQLQFIPAEIVCDKEMQTGKIPLETGFLTGVSNLAYYKYKVNADYKESLSALVPIVIASGIEDMDAFNDDNGRRYFASGAASVNIVRNENAKITITESGQTLAPYESYFERCAKEVKAIGGVYNSEAAVARTATEVINDSGMLVAILTPMTNNIEPSIKTMVAYCGVFEGIYDQDDITAYIEDVKITMPRDFAVSKLTFNEVKTYIELYDAGHMSNQEMLKVLDLGGWLVSDAEVLGLEIDNGGGSLTKD